MTAPVNQPIYPTFENTQNPYYPDEPYGPNTPVNDTLSYSIKNPVPPPNPVYNTRSGKGKKFTTYQQSLLPGNQCYQPQYYQNQGYPQNPQTQIIYVTEQQQPKPKQMSDDDCLAVCCLGICLGCCAAATH